MEVQKMLSEQMANDAATINPLTQNTKERYFFTGWRVSQQSTGYGEKKQWEERKRKKRTLKTVWSEDTNESYYAQAFRGKFAVKMFPVVNNFDIMV